MSDVVLAEPEAADAQQAAVQAVQLWPSLSPELLQEVCGALDPASVACARQVCSTWARGISLALSAVCVTLPCVEAPCPNSTGACGCDTLWSLTTAASNTTAPSGSSDTSADTTRPLYFSTRAAGLSAGCQPQPMAAAHMLPSATAGNGALPQHHEQATGGSGSRSGEEEPVGDASSGSPHAMAVDAPPLRRRRRSGEEGTGRTQPPTLRQRHGAVAAMPSERCDSSGQAAVAAVATPPPGRPGLLGRCPPPRPPRAHALRPPHHQLPPHCPMTAAFALAGSAAPPPPPPPPLYPPASCGDADGGGGDSGGGTTQAATTAQRAAAGSSAAAGGRSGAHNAAAPSTPTPSHTKLPAPASGWSQPRHRCQPLQVDLPAMQPCTRMAASVRAAFPQAHHITIRLGGAWDADSGGGAASPAPHAGAGNTLELASRGAAMCSLAGAGKAAVAGGAAASQQEQELRTPATLNSTQHDHASPGGCAAQGPWHVRGGGSGGGTRVHGVVTGGGVTSVSAAAGPQQGSAPVTGPPAAWGAATGPPAAVGATSGAAAGLTIAPAAPPQRHCACKVPALVGDVLGALRLLWHAEATHVTVVGDLPFQHLAPAHVTGQELLQQRQGRLSGLQEGGAGRKGHTSAAGPPGSGCDVARAGQQTQQAQRTHSRHLAPDVAAGLLMAMAEVGAGSRGGNHSAGSSGVGQQGSGGGGYDNMLPTACPATARATVAAPAPGPSVSMEVGLEQVPGSAEHGAPGIGAPGKMAALQLPDEMISPGESRRGWQGDERRSESQAIAPASSNAPPGRQRLTGDAAAQAEGSGDGSGGIGEDNPWRVRLPGAVSAGVIEHLLYAKTSADIQLDGSSSRGDDARPDQRAPQQQIMRDEAPAQLLRSSQGERDGIHTQFEGPPPLALQLTALPVNMSARRRPVAQADNASREQSHAQAGSGGLDNAVAVLQPLGLPGLAGLAAPSGLGEPIQPPAEDQLQRAGRHSGSSQDAYNGNDGGSNTEPQCAAPAGTAALRTSQSNSHHSTGGTAPVSGAAPAELTQQQQQCHASDETSNGDERTGSGTCGGMSVPPLLSSTILTPGESAPGVSDMHDAVPLVAPDEPQLKPGLPAKQVARPRPTAAAPYLAHAGHAMVAASTITWAGLLAPLQQLVELRLLGYQRLPTPGMLRELAALPALRVLDLRLAVTPASQMGPDLPPLLGSAASMLRGSASGSATALSQQQLQGGPERVTDAHLEALALALGPAGEGGVRVCGRTSRRLAELHLNNVSAVTGDGLAHLRALTALRALSLCDALSARTVTGAHVQALLAALPFLRCLALGRAMPLWFDNAQDHNHEPAAHGTGPATAAAGLLPVAAAGGRVAAAGAQGGPWGSVDQLQAQLGWLQYLGLQFVHFLEEPVLAAVPQLSMLQALDLEGIDLSYAQVMTLAAAFTGFPALRHLMLGACVLYDAHLAAFAALTQLRQLTLQQVDVRTRDMNGWTCLAPLTSLTRFEFQEWRNPALSVGNLALLTDESVVMMATHWKELVQLRYLGKVSLTPRARCALASLPRLAQLHIIGPDGTRCVGTRMCRAHHAPGAPAAGMGKAAAALTGVAGPLPAAGLPGGRGGQYGVGLGEERVVLGSSATSDVCSGEGGIGRTLGEPPRPLRQRQPDPAVGTKAILDRDTATEQEHHKRPHQQQQQQQQAVVPPSRHKAQHRDGAPVAKRLHLAGPPSAAAAPASPADGSDAELRPASLSARRPAPAPLPPGGDVAHGGGDGMGVGTGEPGNMAEAAAKVGCPHEPPFQKKQQDRQERAQGREEQTMAAQQVRRGAVSMAAEQAMVPAGHSVAKPQGSSSSTQGNDGATGKVSSSNGTGTGTGRAGDDGHMLPINTAVPTTRPRRRHPTHHPRAYPHSPVAPQLPPRLTTSSAATGLTPALHPVPPAVVRSDESKGAAVALAAWNTAAADLAAGRQQHGGASGSPGNGGTGPAAPGAKPLAPLRVAAALRSDDRADIAAAATDSPAAPANPNPNQTLTHAPAPAGLAAAAAGAAAEQLGEAGAGGLQVQLLLPHAKLSSCNGYLTHSGTPSLHLSQGSEESVNWGGAAGAGGGGEAEDEEDGGGDATGPQRPPRA